MGVGALTVLLAVGPWALVAALGAWSVYLRSGPTATLLVIAAFPVSVAVFGTYYVLFLRRSALILTRSHLIHRRALRGTTSIPRSAISRVVVAQVAFFNQPPFPHTFVFDRDGRELLAGAWGAWDPDEISELWRRVCVAVDDQGDAVLRRADLYAAFPGIRWHRRYGGVTGAVVAGVLGGAVAWAFGMALEGGPLVTVAVTAAGALIAAGIGAPVGLGVDAWSLWRAQRRLPGADQPLGDA